MSKKETAKGWIMQLLKTLLMRSICQFIRWSRLWKILKQWSNPQSTYQSHLKHQIIKPYQQGQLWYRNLYIEICKKWVLFQTKLWMTMPTTLSRLLFTHHNSISFKWKMLCLMIMCTLTYLLLVKLKTQVVLTFWPMLVSKFQSSVTPELITFPLSSHSMNLQWPNNPSTIESHPLSISIWKKVYLK